MNQTAHADDIVYPSAVPFLLIHLAAFAAIWTGVTTTALVMGAVLYALRMFGVTAGYHRYFSHRAYTTSRAFQFVLALLAQSTAQKSVLWWAAKHRHHHRYADTPDDVHSPRHTGFLYSHVGWIFARKHDAADLSVVPDLTRYPELRWLHRYEHVPAIGLALICLAIGGWSGLVVGFVWSTVLVYHATFCINSLAHVRGSTRYVTGDDSRNNIALALLTMGEGWHNNHHAFQSSARQGFRWWEVDMTFYILTMLSWVGIVSALKKPPVGVLRNEQRLGAKVIARTSEQLADRFCAERIAGRLRASWPEAELAALRATLVAQAEASGALWHRFHPHLPSRDALLAEARTLFAGTPSLDEIVDRAHAMVMAAVGRQLEQTA
ncbi:acyl-CoA desaturase [Sphingomonas mollis]|uniref:Fatty acid desaturase n=1 Tax=Sphingomonas mollis TaxID=2795726 RepID=A0ABS0XRX1_9SPHN|nr:fatty acid desaturase [Sphingomonas sp. BT553]MBJ6122788.1 fatty acid desaturase [Sphingomonas sp. BT553]